MSNYEQIETDRIKDYITNLPSVANKKKADGASITTPTTSTTIQAADSEASKTSENEKLKSNRNSTSIEKIRVPTVSELNLVKYLQHQ